MARWCEITMLSDEERKIETLKKYINSQEQKINDYYKIDEEFYKDEIDQLELSIKLLRYILNLIKKQSKEIEEYNKQLDLDYVDKHYVPIERYNQLEKEIEELNKSDASKEQSSMKYYNLYKELVDKIKAKIEEVKDGTYDAKIVLESLLEKE